MEKKIRIKCPAKINLTLEIVNKRDDGFHNIKIPLGIGSSEPVYRNRFREAG